MFRDNTGCNSLPFPNYLLKNGVQCLRDYVMSYYVFCIIGYLWKETIYVIRVYDDRKNI